MRFVTLIRALLDTDKSVRKVAEDIQTTSELFLLLRVIYADGVMEPEEFLCFKEICKHDFGIPEKDLMHVYEYVIKIATDMSIADAAKTFKGLDKERKQALLTRMYRVAESDHEIVYKELDVINHIADIIGMRVIHVQQKAA